MKVLTLAVLAFCMVQTEGHKLSQHQQQGLRSHQKLRSHLHSQSHSMSHSASRSHLRSHAGVRYEESEGPTKVDFGDGDEYQITREADLNAHKDKSSGWTNPLSWEDDGTDDDSILNLGYDTSKLKDEKDSIQQDNTLDEDIKTTLDNEALSQELVVKQRVKWAEMERKNAEEDAQIEAQEQAARKQKKGGKGKKAPAAEEEPENPKASVAGEKEDNKKAAKNTVKQQKEAKTEKPEAASKESGEEEKKPKAEPASEKKEKAAADDKKKVAAEEKKEDDASAVQQNDEPQPVRIQSQAQVRIEDLSDKEINLIQKKMKEAEDTDLLDQDLNSEPYDLF